MPKSKEQFEAMKMASVERINDAGVRLFAMKGLGGTSINEIAKEAGISIGLMYHYYKSKEDLYAELVKLAVTNANDFLIQLLNMEISPKEKVKIFTKNILDSLKKSSSSSPYYFALMDQAMLNANLPKAAKAYTKMAFESVYSLQSIIKAGQKAGEIKGGDSMSLATLYLSALHGLCSFKLMAGGSFSTPKAAWVDEILVNKTIK